MIDSNVVVRPAFADHVDVVMNLHRTVLRRGTLPRGYLVSLIDQNPAFLALSGVDVVGFVYTRQFAPDILEVLNIVVADDFRSRGVGTAMLRAVETAAVPGFTALILVNSQLYVGTPGKRDASAFYQRNGFRLLYSSGPSNIFIKDL